MLAFDAELSAIFTVIVALDAVETVPAHTVVFRRVMLCEWVAAVPTARAQLHIVSLLSPLIVSLSAPMQGESPAPSEHFHERLRRATKDVRLLQLLGIAELLLLLVGVPWAVAAYSGIGLLTAVFATVAVCLLGASVAVHQWKELNAGTRPPLRKLIGWCSPFSAPRAAEDVLREVFRGASAVTIAYSVLSRPHFSAWIRPWAYDHLAGYRNAAINGLMTDSELAAIVGYVPKDGELGAVSYCPRCGQSWAISAGHCNGCHVGLVAVSSVEA